MISDLEASILGLVHEGFQYGYELEKTIEERNMRRWTEIAFSSIYYILKKLEKKELITSKNEQVSGRTRKVYTITPQGKTAMKEKTRELISKHHSVTNPFDLGIANLNNLTHNEAITGLLSYIESIDEKERFYRGRLAEIELSDWPYHIRGLMTRPLALLEAERKWVEGYIEELKEQHRAKEESHAS
jgi:DNA-binding PadR family transcriptional regulator